MAALTDHHISALYLLDYGTFEVGTNRTIGIPGYLLTTDQGAHILIGTDFPPDYAAAEARRDDLARFGQLTRQNAAGQQLALLNLTPPDISLLILTHSDIDHLGRLPLFACPILLAKAERAQPEPLYFGTSRPMDWPDRSHLTIQADTQARDPIPPDSPQP